MTSIETIQIPDDTRVLPVSTVQGEPTFPWKLHQVLQESERLGFSKIISWQGERTFRVHNQALFESRIMRKYFKQTQYRSFQRQCTYKVSARRKATVSLQRSLTFRFLFLAFLTRNTSLFPPPSFLSSEYLWVSPCKNRRR